MQHYTRKPCHNRRPHHRPQIPDYRSAPDSHIRDTVCRRPAAPINAACLEAWALAVGSAPVGTHQVNTDALVITITIGVARRALLHRLSFPHTRVPGHSASSTQGARVEGVDTNCAPDNQYHWHSSRPYNGLQFVTDLVTGWGEPGQPGAHAIDARSARIAIGLGIYAGIARDTTRIATPVYHCSSRHSHPSRHSPSRQIRSSTQSQHRHRLQPLA